jgi:TM2 domain-containing membrane protein YozV
MKAKKREISLADLGLDDATPPDPIGRALDGFEHPPEEFEVANYVSLTAKREKKLDTSFHPGLAAVLSFIIPGAGHIYRLEILAGFVWLFATIFGYLLYFVPGFLLHIICIYSSTQPRKSK